MLKSCGQDSTGRAAFEELCQAYWRPLYAFLRRKGRSPQDAEDVIQGFFVWFMERGLAERADPKRGRFRNFLLAALRQFEARQFQYQSAEKRSPERPTVSLDFGDGEANYPSYGTDDKTPEMLFEQTWAASVLDRAMAALRDDMSAAGKERLFDCLRRMMTDGRDSTTKQAAQQLGMSEGAVRVAVHRMKRRFAKKVRAVVAETVENEADIDDEMNELFVILQQSSSFSW